MKRIIGFVCLGLMLLQGANLFALPAPPTCGETAGRTERPGYRSALIDTNMVYTIYLPPCYDHTTDAYPVIYLLHGSNDDDHHWLRLGLQEALDARILAGAMPPVIVVLPFGNWIANENQFGIASWENVFVSEMMPLAESNYRIDTRRAYRAIGGISRGGFWAFQIALRHPDQFSVLGGHSGFFDRFHAPEAYNPLDLVLTLTPQTAPRILIDRGAQDYAAPGLDIMNERLASANLPYTYTIHPEGEHNNLYWRAHIAEYLDFYIADWLPTADTPDDAPPTTPPAVAFMTNTPRPPAAQPTPTATPSAAADAHYVLLPVVAFPSRNASISQATLDRVLSGELDAKLTLSQSVALTLVTQGIVINSMTHIVPDEQVYSALWADRSRWSILPFDQLTSRYRVLWVDEENPLYTDLNAYPLAWTSETPNFEPAKLTRIMLSGVTALTRQSMPVFDVRGMGWASEAIAPITTRPDFFHTSNEVSMVETCPRPDVDDTLLGGNSSFCSKPPYFDVFPLLGLDVVELSGNHNNDYGYNAYLKTLDWYQSQSILTVGGGKTVEEARAPLILDHHENQIAWISCNWVGPYYALVKDGDNGRPGAADCDRDWLAATVPALSAAYDVVIVTVQYWESDAYTPLPQQRADFRWLAELGADVVVGTQAHWPQTFDFAPINTGGEAFIHYGLGNFIFDQPWYANTRFFLDELYIYDGNLQFVDIYTGVIEELGRPRLMTADERTNFLHLMFNEYGGL